MYSSGVLTFEEVVLEAAMLHVLVDEQPVLVLAAVAHQLHQVGVPQLPHEDHLRLHPKKKKHAEIASSEPACHAHFFQVFPRSASGPRAAVRVLDSIARGGAMGHPTHPIRRCRRSPEASRSLTHQSNFR